MSGSIEGPAAMPPARRLLHRVHSVRASVRAERRHQDAAGRPSQSSPYPHLPSPLALSPSPVHPFSRIGRLNHRHEWAPAFVTGGGLVTARHKRARWNVLVTVVCRSVPASGDTDVVVVGGGLAGLAVALYLARAGLRVTLHEKSGHCGGRARTRTIDRFHFNLGPHALYC